MQNKDKRQRYQQTCQISEIRRFLKQSSSKKTRESELRSIPNAKKLYGVSISVINEIVKRCKNADFDLVERLWASQYLEERILSAKLLGKIAKQDANKTLSLIKKISNDITNWAECDTLATQGTRSIIKVKKDEIIKLSKRFVQAKDPYKVRFGIVLLINFKKDKDMKHKIRGIINKVKSSDKLNHRIVKKALAWLERAIENC